MVSSDFNQFRKKALVLSRQLSPRPGSAASAFRQLDEKLGRVKAVSFDIFDTLTSRSVYHPQDVFRFLPGHAAFQVLDLPFSVSIPKQRHKSEHATYARLSRDQGHANANLLEMYEAFCRDVGVDPKRAPSLAAAEEEIELQLGIANEEGRLLFERARESGKPVAIVSDTYHTPGFLARLLAACGYAMEGITIYSSCHYRLSKADGKLFGVVLKDLKIQPKELLHIGDNGHADHLIPSGLGIETLWHPFRAHEDAVPAYHEDAGLVHTLVKSLGERIRMPRRTPHDFWYQLGYRVTGPLLAGFSLWLRKELERNNISRAYFLLRDGAIMHRVYEILVGVDSPCPTRTLPSSRRAMVIPVLDLDTELVIPQLFVAARGDRRTVGGFLLRLGVDPTLFESEIAEVGLVSSQASIDGHAEKRKLMQLFRKLRVTQAIVAQARKERELLLKYLVQEGVIAPGRVAIVDLGWHGSIQKAMAALGRSKHLSGDVLGFYLGTSASFHEGAGAESNGAGYLFHRGEPKGLTKVLTEGREVLETLCSSPDGSLLAFEARGNRTEPIFDKAETDPERLHIFQGLHDGAVAFAEDFRVRQIRHKWSEFPMEVAAENLVRLVTRPSSEEARLLGAFVHGENLGTRQGRALAAFRPESSEPEDLWLDYQHAYWKQGLLFQRNEQSAKLRTLLWLLEDSFPNWEYPTEFLPPPFFK